MTNYVKGTNDPNELHGRTDGNNVIAGYDGDDTLFGGDKRDYLYGGADNDSLFGGGGNDILRGSSGNDTLWGGAGADKLTGGTDADTFDMSDSLNKRGEVDTITDFTPGEDRIQIPEVALLTGFKEIAYDPRHKLAAGEVTWHYDAKSDQTLVEVGRDLAPGADIKFALKGDVDISINDFEGPVARTFLPEPGYDL